jgi:hypothetical protein
MTLALSQTVRGCDEVLRNLFKAWVYAWGSEVSDCPVSASVRLIASLSDSGKKSH